MIDVRRALHTVSARVSTMIARGIISRVNDALETQGLQIELRVGEVADEVEHMQPFGLNFHPPVDSEVIVLAVSGAQDHLLALNATKRSDRPTGISEGEGGLYTPTGWKVFLAADDTVNLGDQMAADFVALASKVDTELSKIQTSFGSVGGTPAVVGTPYIPGPVAATKTKAT